MAKERVGFIGLGLMGSGMAKNILAKGHPLTVLAHRRREAVDRLVAAGAREVSSPRQMAAACDVVVICVTGSPEVEALLTGPDGLASTDRPLLVIDCSTSEPSSTTRLAAALAPRGVTLIDAPLSRTPKDAEAGTLDVMVGGADDVVARARPVIDCFAGRVVHTGPTGTGHTMKLLNNFVSLGYGAIYAEALTLGMKAGLTPAVFEAVIKDGRMDCPFFRTYFQWVVGRDPNAHRFTLKNGFKDLGYLAAFANAAGIANPIGAAVRNSFATAVNTGHAEDFVPMLSDVVAEMNGVSLAPENT
ncbi:MAG: NAD(P)-dependent oxidoreductase [Rhizobiaceae bacterium]|nr:NAD(P)-dependent oxidoreductase [Rhizobiaceae bacterium]